MTRCHQDKKTVTHRHSSDATVHELTVGATDSHQRLSIEHQDTITAFKHSNTSSWKTRHQ